MGFRPVPVYEWGGDGKVLISTSFVISLCNYNRPTKVADLNLKNH